MRRRRNDYIATSAEHAVPTLYLHDLVFIGVGCTLGSGLFLLTGHVARDVAGPSVVLSYSLAAFACLLSALSYAEMSSRLSNAGGAYAFSYLGLGELPAFLVGMCLTLEYGVGAAAVARSWASYLGDALPFLPSWATGINSRLCILGALLIIAVSALLSIGMREAKWVINICTFLYSSLVVVIVAFGSQHIDTANWKPFFPYGAAGLITGASAVFFSFVGFDEVATLAEEAHSPGRNVPLAIIISMAIVTSMYVSASLVLTGTVPYKDILVSAPFSAAMRHINIPILARLVGLGTAFGMMNSTLVGFAAQPRIFVSMGRDGLLPRALASSTGKTTLVCGAVVSLLALFVRTESLADVVSGGTLVAFLATNLSLLLTRARLHGPVPYAPRIMAGYVAGCATVSVIVRLSVAHEASGWISYILGLPFVLVPFGMILRGEYSAGVLHERDPPTFLCPLVPVLPLLGALTTVFLIVQLAAKALTALVTWLILSTVIYFSYSVHHALIANDYRSVANADGSPTTGSLTALDEFAVEAHSISDEDETRDDHADMVVKDAQSDIKLDETSELYRAENDVIPKSEMYGARLS